MAKYSVGLVLSGGAARGFAHLGVLKALEENGLKPDIISGVSAGAIAGAFYADGYSPEEILEIYSGKNFLELIKITIPKTGLFQLAGMKKMLNKYLRARKFEDLKIPLVITATNLTEGTTVYFRQGILIDAILASSAVPVLFEAVKINNELYIDGGITNNLPVAPIINECRKLIGVYVNHSDRLKSIKGFAQVAERAFHLAISGDIEKKKKLFDIFIEPKDMSVYGFFNLKKGQELFRKGYNATIETLKQKKYIK